MKQCKVHPEIRLEKGERCKKCGVDRVTKWRLETKKKLVAIKGGACSKCGYDRCLGALEFHHLDPTQKEFQINMSATKAFEKLLAEAEKCVLLCANCHREEHEAQRVIS